MLCWWLSVHKAVGLLVLYSVDFLSWWLPGAILCWFPWLFLGSILCRFIWWLHCSILCRFIWWLHCSILVDSIGGFPVVFSFDPWWFPASILWCSLLVAWLYSLLISLMVAWYYSVCWLLGWIILYAWIRGRIFLCSILCWFSGWILRLPSGCSCGVRFIITCSVTLIWSIGGS